MTPKIFVPTKIFFYFYSVIIRWHRHIEAFSFVLHFESGKFSPAEQTMDAYAYSVGITCLRDGLPEPRSAAGFVPRFFYWGTWYFRQGQPIFAGMKEKTLFELLQSIPESCQEATIQGIRMEMIDISIKEDLLALDSEGMTFHECILKNGTFVFSTDGNHRLQTLFKVFRQVQKDVHWRQAAPSSGCSMRCPSK